ncbi:MAG: N-6 DNA methylase [Gemmatimonadota bacterium]
MLTTRAAHSLLTATGTHAGLLALTRALGFTDEAHQLSRRTVRTLTLPADLQVTRITRGPLTAALLVERLPVASWRDALRHLATYLDRLADPRRYLLILQCADDGPLAIACWLSSTRGPRLAVLTTSSTHPLDSDAQTVAALSASWHPDPTRTVLRWHDLLGRHAIGARFFRTLDTHVTQLADAWPDRVEPDDRRTLALIHVARLLFLKFLETKGWLDHDRAFLARHAEACLANGGHLWPRLLAPLTFGTLNTPHRHRAPSARAFGAVPFLNGGLFACSPLERRTRRPALHDAQLTPLILDTLARYRFTAREDAASWSEAAIDPDLLGRTFEALMDTNQRRGSGTFYTPAALGNTLVEDALAHALGHPPHVVRDAMQGASVDARDANALRDRLSTFRILDPACGSGSLLVNALETVAALHATLGDPRPVHLVRREVLTHTIFGVDIAPMAVWLCELRLWLSIVIDDDTTHPNDIAPLPNLDHHIRLGDALGNDAFAGPRTTTSRRIAALREHYATSAGSRKRHAASRIEAAERAAARQVTSHAIATLRQERAQLLRLARARTLFGTRQGSSAAQRRRLATLRTLLLQARRNLRRLDDGGAVDFDFRTHFADAAAAGGFDLVLGNPPWVRSHHLDASTRANLRTRFATVTSHPTGHQPFGVQTDIAIPFTQRGLELARPGGTLAFLLPAKLWRSVAAGALRQHLLTLGTPRLLRDHSHSSGGFSAAVYPSAIVVQRAPLPTTEQAMPHTDMECHTTDASGTPRQFTVPAAQLAANEHAGAPWRLIPSDVRTAADAIRDAGHRWTESLLPPPALGIKTGCNDAFLLADADVPPSLRPFTRPVLRGDQVRAWHTDTGTTAIVVPCDASGATLRALPGPLARHFANHQRALLARTDLRPRDPWWSLFRTDLLATGGWRVVWADIGRTLRATILPPHHTAVPLNTCYGVRLHDAVDAHALAALLNAPTTSAWLSLVAEPARGGYHRFMGWTVLALPLPDWQRAREMLAPLAARARRGESVTATALHQATLDAYRVSHAHVAPLLEWCATQLRHERESHDASQARAS